MNCRIEKIGVFRAVFLLMLCMTLAFCACLPNPEAIGSDHEVVVVVSEATWVVFEEPVRALFGRTIRTPQEEAVFSIRVAAPKDFDFFRKFKNILVLSPLNVEDDGAELTLSLLSDEARISIQRGRANMFTKRDIWARNQTLMILAAPGSVELSQVITEQGDEIFQVQEEALNEKVREWLYEEDEQTKLEAKLLDHYGWTLRVPGPFFVEKEFPEDRFLFLRRTIPERWLFVYWEEAIGPEALTVEWFKQTRLEIGERFYGGDRIVEEYLQIDPVTFVDWEALRMTGLWQNNSAEAGFASGGPFRSYAFYEPTARRLYLVDIAVFAPGMAKEPYLRQLDIIANTFHL